MNPALPEPPRNPDIWHVTNELCLRSWDGEYVAYHRLSGETHLLGMLTGQLLQTLQATPANAASLCQTLAPLLKIKPDEEFRLQINSLLAELDELFLIERT